MTEHDLLQRCAALMRNLLENAQFFQSAIELDPFDWGIDGEKIKEEMQQLVEEIELSGQNTPE